MNIASRIVCFCLLITLLIPAASYADKKPKSITIGTWNLEWFFDAHSGDNHSDLSRKQSAPSKNDWNWKLEKVAAVIGTIQPTILALQEIENKKVLRELTKKLSDKYRLKYRIAYIEGNDTFTGQDVAVIYQSGLVSFRFHEQNKEMFNSKKFFNLTKHLIAKFEWGSGSEKQSLTLLTAHLRAGAKKNDLRQRQCRLIRHWLNQEISNGENVVILGDLNTEAGTGRVSPKSDLGILLNNENSDKSDDLIDLHEALANTARSTHVAGKQFDRILISDAMARNAPRIKDLAFSRIKSFRDLVIIAGPDRNHFDGYYNIPQNKRDISDHYPVVAEFLFK